MWAALRRGIWHITLPNRYESILADREIRPEPKNVRDVERYGTLKGVEGYPYVRSIGGVSLFDFDGFDPIARSDHSCGRAWHTFVPYPSTWDSAIWLEITRTAVAPNLVSAAELKEGWEKGNQGRKLIPEIEIAHRGPLPIIAITCALRVLDRNGRFEQLPLPR